MQIINSSLATGYVPTLFKQAYVTPLLKKSGLDDSIAANYRPVSNLSVLSKLLERAVHRQVEPYLRHANLFPLHQSAYRKHHSTETILTRVCSDLITQLDKGDCSLMSFLDLSAAFDTVDKQILLSRLSTTFGINNTALKWFDSYLSDRTEFVLFNNNRSPVRSVKYGVPQGSVLGPLLFVLYTSDLELIAHDHDVEAHFYADDSQLYIFSKLDKVSAKTAEERLLRCLDSVAEWMKSNRLSLNPSKTQFMRCATQRRLSQLNTTPILFRGESITPASSVRNLGVIVDQSLSFRPHISHVVSSCFYQLRRMKSSLKRLPSNTVRDIVNSFVISRIDYCNCLLAKSPQCSLRRLQRVMNAAARLVCGAGRRAHITPLLRDRLHWLRIEQRVTYKLCLLVYKTLHDMAPSYLSELCRPAADNPARTKLRSAMQANLQVPRTRTLFGDRAFAVSGPLAWNNLPADLRAANNIIVFKSKLKTYLFSQ